MAKEQKKKESVLIKFYIIFLFILGIGVWYCLQPSQKQKIYTDLELDKKIEAILFDNGISQVDIISQYIKEMGDNSLEWKEYHKKIVLKSNNGIEKFEKIFKTVASSSKLGLKKTSNADGSVAYKFYDPKKRTFSEITLVPSKLQKLKKAS